LPGRATAFVAEGASRLTGAGFLDIAAESDGAVVVAGGPDGAVSVGVTPSSVERRARTRRRGCASSVFFGPEEFEFFSSGI
jgi:hypothetical protein